MLVCFAWPFALVPDVPWFDICVAIIYGYYQGCMCNEDWTPLFHLIYATREVLERNIVSRVVLCIAQGDRDNVSISTSCPPSCFSPPYSLRDRPFQVIRGHS